MAASADPAPKKSSDGASPPLIQGQAPASGCACATLQRGSALPPVLPSPCPSFRSRRAVAHARRAMVKPGGAWLLRASARTLPYCGVSPYGGYRDTRGGAEGIPLRGLSAPTQSAAPPSSVSATNTQVSFPSHSQVVYGITGPKMEPHWCLATSLTPPHLPGPSEPDPSANCSPIAL